MQANRPVFFPSALLYALELHRKESGRSETVCFWPAKDPNLNVPASYWTDTGLYWTRTYLLSNLRPELQEGESGLPKRSPFGAATLSLTDQRESTTC